MEGSIIAFSIIFLIVALGGAALLRNLEDTLEEMSQKHGWVPRRYIYNAYIGAGIILTAGFGWLWCLLLMIFRTKYGF